MQIRPLDPIADRAAVATLLSEAQDYYHLWLGHAPGEAQVDDVFAAGPPGCDPAKSHRLGLYLTDPAVGPSGTVLSGVAELSFGFPTPDDAYLGLMILAPRARSARRGAAFLTHVETLASARNCPRLYLGVLEANGRGMAFWRSQGFNPTGVSRADPETGHTIHRLVKLL